MRVLAILMLFLGAAGGLVSSAISAQGAAFGEASRVAGAANTFVAAPFAIDYQGTLYEYATNEDGKGHYTTSDDGQTYTGWTGWDDQPAGFQWQPTAVVFGGKQYIFYDGQDGGLYHDAWDGSAWSGWENLAGDFTFRYAPFANAYDNAVYLYSVAQTNDLHYKVWSDGHWSGWESVSDKHKAGGFQPFALEWGGQENVFWTGTDGQVYWNRYDGTAWRGAEALPVAEDVDASIQFSYAPFAVGYVPEQALYAFAVARDGTPFRTVYTDENGWSGWEPYGTEAPAQVMNQPSVSVYAGKQHMVYTGQDHHAYYTFYDGDWGDWQDLGDNVDFDPFQYEFAGNLHLTYTGLDGDVYVRPFSGALTPDSTPGPPAEEGVTGVTTELLGRHPAAVAPGQALALTRLTFAPGGNITAHTHPGDTVYHLLSGSLAFTLLQGEARLVRATNGTPTVGTPTADEPVPVGTEITLNAGDTIYYSSSALQSERNAGDGDAVVMVANLRGSDEPARVVEGGAASPGSGTPVA